MIDTKDRMIKYLVGWREAVSGHELTEGSKEIVDFMAGWNDGRKALADAIAFAEHAYNEKLLTAKYW